MRRRFLALLLFGLMPLPCFAQETRSETQERSKGFFRELWTDQKIIWTAPVRKETWKSPNTYVMLGLAASSFALDGDASRCLRESSSFQGFDDVFASTAADVVLSTYPLGPLAAGEIAGNRRMADYGLAATRSALNAAAVSLVLKAVTQRARPHTGEVYGFWKGGNSFPSGHATIAWSVAATTVRYFGNHRWVPFVAYPLAGLISFSRITSGNHYASDATTGAVLGYAIGGSVAR